LIAANNDLGEVDILADALRPELVNDVEQITLLP
jgi:hypothetical protein